MSYELNEAVLQNDDGTPQGAAETYQDETLKTGEVLSGELLRRNMGLGFPYSLGRDKYDNKPVQRVAPTFTELKDEFLSARPNSKGQKYICAPMKKGPHKDPVKHPGEHHFRCKEHAMPSSHLSLDLDGFGSVAIYEAFKLIMGNIKGFGYTTSSHTAEEPRMRVILEADRLMDRAECIKVSAAIQAHVEELLGKGVVKFDRSVYRSEQPVYSPLQNAQVFDFDGKVVCVDLWLERYEAGLGIDLVSKKLLDGDDDDDGERVEISGVDESLLPEPAKLERIERFVKNDRPKLYAGEWKGQRSRASGKEYPSQSEADQAMANAIAREVRRAGVVGNVEVANCTLHEFNKTGLAVRDKWRTHPTYRTDTIANAVAATADVAADAPLTIPGRRPLGTGGSGNGSSDGWVELLNAPESRMFTLTDTGNAERLQAAWGEHVIWVHELSQWMMFIDGVWVACTPAVMSDRATAVMKSIFNEAAEAGTRQEANAISNHAQRSLNTGALHAALEALKGKCGVQVLAAQLDASDMVLGTSDGMLIDLTTGQVRKQVPGDLITKATGCAYDPQAACPAFIAFLRSLFCGLTGSTGPDDDQGMIQYMQMAFGYCLTGKVVEKMFFFAFGGGDNGKSRLVEVLRELLGSYAIIVSTNAFMQRNDTSGATPEIARLQGMRLAVATETNDHQVFDEALVKAVTGGEMFSARRLYGSPFEFMPKFKLFMSGNDKPIIRSDGRAMWSRLHLMPFERVFEVHQQDKGLAAKLSAELPGILNWAIEGCLLWQKAGGLTMPPRMLAGVQQYKTDMDLIQQWMSDCCKLAPTLTTLSAPAYASFGNWCKQNGHRVITQTKFSMKLAERGFVKQHSRVGKVWEGFETSQGVFSGLI